MVIKSIKNAHLIRICIFLPSTGWYGVPDGLFFSFPVTMDPKGYWHVVQDSELTPEVKEGIVKAVEVISPSLI